MEEACEPSLAGGSLGIESKLMGFRLCDEEEYRLWGGGAEDALQGFVKCGE
jgi:hypothetical protein